MNEVQFATLPTRKIFFRCALPGLLAMVVSSIYMMIDGIFVGRYIGSHALAAVNLAFPVIMILFAVGDMVAVGSSVKIALLLGQGKNKEANGLFSAAFCMILGIGVLFSLVGFLAAPRLIALLIKVRMPGGPVIFKQQRVGRNGELFTMYKFRSMTVSHSGSSVSVAGESRITPLGSILRKYKLDELPELWNVLKGDMSFVGPRPDVPGYADRLQGENRLILKLRPGITGPASLKYANEEEILAQVSNPVKYNDEVIFPDKVRINLNYYHNHTFWGDIRLIFQTIFRSYELAEIPK